MVAALALGCTAALLWAAVSLTSAPAVRAGDPWVTALWTSVAATVVSVLLALPSGLPSAGGSDLAYVVLAGAAYTGGTTMWMASVAGGQVSLVVPIVAADGAIAAVLAVLAGQRLSAPAAIALGGMAMGIVLIGAGSPRAPAPGPRALRIRPPAHRSLGRTVAIAGSSAVCFGVVFFAAGRVGTMQPMWVVALSRSIPSICLLALCLRRGTLAPAARTWRWILPCGALDATGYAAYVLAARHDLAVAAVATSQYAAVGAIAGFALLGERLSKRQVAAIALLAVSAGVIAATAG